MDLSGEGQTYNPTDFVEEYVPDEEVSLDSDLKQEQDIPLESEVKPEPKSSPTL